MSLRVEISLTTKASLLVNPVPVYKGAPSLSNMLLLLSIATMFLFALAPATYNFTLMSALILIVVIILFITDIFYIRHYYQLENGTQRLYDLSKSLYDLTHKH